MSDETADNSVEDNGGSAGSDAMVDALSAVAVVVIPVLAVIYWLSGMPT